MASEQDIPTQQEITEALKIHQDIDTEEQNWRKSRRTVGKLLRVAQGAAALVPRIAELQAEIAQLQGNKTSLEQSARELRKELDELKGDLRDAQKAGKLRTLIAEREAHAAALNTEIAEKESRKAAQDADYEAFRTRHSL